MPGYGLSWAYNPFTVLTIIYSGRYGDDYPNMALNSDDAPEFWTVLDKDSIIDHITTENMTVNEKVNNADELILSAGDELKIPINNIKEDAYFLFLEYKALDAKTMDCYLTIDTGSKEYKASIPVIWKDKEGEYPLDQYGNELPKEQVNIDSYVINAVENASSINKSNLEITLDPSVKKISLKTDVQGLAVKSVYITKKPAIKNYTEYQASINKNGGSNNEQLVVLEGETYSLKSDSFIRGEGLKDPALHLMNREEER